MRNKMSKYDFTYTGLMTGSTQSIPLGNGDLGVNAWMEQDGIYLLLSKTDNWSETYRLLKTGLVKISFAPNPFDENTKFHFHLYDGYLTIYDAKSKTDIRLYIDANYPAYRIEMKSEKELTYAVEIINYRDSEIQLSHDDFSNYHMMQEKQDYTGDYSAKESADILFSMNEHSIGQYHRNLWSCYRDTLILQGLEDYIGRETDPFFNRTFGYTAFSNQMTANGVGMMRTIAPQKSCSITIYSINELCEDISDWKSKLNLLQQNDKEDFEAHKSYWHTQWQSCYIFVSGSEQAEICTKSFIYQRYFNLCAGAGAFPIKFNGSIFCAEESPNVKDKKNYDYRAWGAPYWLQNTRLIYWNMLFCGDFEMMKPFFSMYKNALSFAKYRTREYFGHEGAFFPETMTFFGSYTNKDYGWNRENKHKSTVDNPYIRLYHVGALEVGFMMLKYYEYTNDQELLEDTIVPFLVAVLTFFDQHYEKRDGEIYLHPTSSLETWHECINDSPTIAGLMAITEFINAHAIRNEQLNLLSKHISVSLPPIPMGAKQGLDVISPYKENIDLVKKNIENPELYPVFPYLLYGVGRDNIETAVNTYLCREEKDAGGWQQHAPQAAILGLSEEAFFQVSSNFARQNEKFIFPGFWGPNYDWTPDQDHGNVAGIGLIQMLLQSGQKTIRILPAWVKELDVSFRLPTAFSGWVTCEYKAGEISSLDFENVSKEFEIIK